MTIYIPQSSFMDKYMIAAFAEIQQSTWTGLLVVRSLSSKLGIIC